MTDNDICDSSANLTFKCNSTAHNNSLTTLLVWHHRI